jgi:translation initiation factor 3 subunit J
MARRRCGGRQRCTYFFRLARTALGEAGQSRRETDEQDDWDKDSEDEKKAKTSTSAAAPTKKKMSLKQKLAEKERLAQEKVRLARDGRTDLVERG